MLSGLLKSDITVEVNIRFNHCGASIKDLGNKTFAINKFIKESVNDRFLNKIRSIINMN